MKGFRLKAWSTRLVVPVLAGCLIAGTATPLPALADTNLVIGGTSVIADANGDRVRLRTAPGYDQSEIARFPEGTEVTVLDGTTEASDGSLWYKVSVNGQTGYIVSDFLTNSDGGSVRTSGKATTNDSVNVRKGPGTSTAVVTSLASGESVMLTGGSSAGWVSVSAAGGDGWVKASFLDVGASEGSSGTTGTRYTIDTVHLRKGPGTSYASITYLQVGVTLELTGNQQNGFVEVTSEFGTGWVFAQYIDSTAPSTPETPPTPEQPGETGTRYTIDTVHLRTGPGTTFDSITYLDAGVQLTLTGKAQDGFVEVTTADFGTGWVSTQYIGTTAPETPTPPTTPPATSTRFTTANVNLRSEPSSTGSVVSLLPLGTELQFSGVASNGFSQVTGTAGSGWVSSEFLSDTKPTTPTTPEPQEDSLVVWPVSGGEWYVSQGYNGSSHQNSSSSWQYYYSFDLKKSDGNTAGQPVYSAVSGTIRWIDEAYGGMSIYMGDGTAYAYFHTLIDPSLKEGDTITQGQYMGTIAPAGQAGNGGTAHIHITVWTTSDEGNWDRHAVPFTGALAISGNEFPATGASNTYRGFTFNP